MAPSYNKVLSSIKIISVFFLLLLASKSPYYLYLIKLVAINLIVVYGLNVVMGFAGQPTVGQAALFAIGGYTSAILVTSFGWPIFLSGVIAIMISLIAALFLAIPSFKLGGIHLAVLTIAFNIIVHQLIINLDKITKGPIGITGIPPLIPNSINPIINLILILVFVYAAYRLNKNILQNFFVRELWAIRENEFLASAFGINPYWTKIIAFEINAIFAGLGGILYGHTIFYISPDSGNLFHSFMFVMMLIAGGSGTLVGPVMGAAIITIIPELMHEFDYFRQTIFGLLLILIALFFTKGIYGLIDNLLDKLLPGQRSKPNINVLDMKTVSEFKRRSLPLPNEIVLLRVESIEKSFGGVKALARVSLDVVPNSIHAVIGPNGSGKTTLINVISGLFLPDKGKAIFAGESILGLRSHQVAKKGITRTFQNLNLLEEQTVMQNVLLGLHPWWRGSVIQALLGTRRSKMSEREKWSFCYQIIENLGIKDLAFKKVSELSYGQRKLVEVCRALASQPSLLLLDEPTSGLSPSEISEFVNLLRRVKEMGLTTILIEHHLDIVESISDYVTVLDEGKVIAHGTYKEVVQNARVTEAYLGEAFQAQIV